MSEGRRRAILIAASEFSDGASLTDLRCPKNDVEGLMEVLTSSEFGLFSESLPFVNQPCHTTLKAINRIFKESKRDDQILIYYSGHGQQDAAGHLHLATTDTEADALETSSIPIGMLRRLIDNYACKQVALILDCCFSGAVGKDFLKSGVDDQLKQTFRDRGIYILTASTATQTAREKEGEQYSLFTKHILHGIRQAEADHDGDGMVSLDDLYEYVRKRVPREAPQYPTKWEFGVQGNELFIARAVKVYSADRLQTFRAKILSIEDEIDDDVYLQALRVIKENQPKRDKDYFVLLNDLYDDHLSPGKFCGKWLRLDRPHSDLAEKLANLLTSERDEPLSIIASTEDMPSLIKLMSQTIAAVERGMKVIGRGDSFLVALRAGFLAVAERYPFLDPFADAFTYENEEIVFSDNVEPNEFVMGVLKGLNQVVEDVCFSTKSREVIRPIADELRKVERESKSLLNHFNLNNLTERICKI